MTLPSTSTAVIQRLAHAAQCVAAVPGACAAALRGQALQAMQVVGGRPAVDGLQHLAQGRCQILGVEIVFPPVVSASRRPSAS